jgi:heme-degrading monooxygenase HmoA
MRARMATAHIKTDRLEEGIELFQRSVVPTAEGAQGFRGFFLLTEPDTGKYVAISMWRSEEDLLDSQSDEGYLGELVARFEAAGVLASPPIFETYDVSVMS